MNKTTIFTWFLLLLTFVSKIEGKNGPDPLVYTIPIKQEINHTTRLFLQHGMEETEVFQRLDTLIQDVHHPDVQGHTVGGFQRLAHRIEVFQCHFGL